MTRAPRGRTLFESAPTQHFVDKGMPLYVGKVLKVTRRRFCYLSGSQMMPRSEEPPRMGFEHANRNRNGSRLGSGRASEELRRTDRLVLYGLSFPSHQHGS